MDPKYLQIHQNHLQVISKELQQFLKPDTKITIILTIFKVTEVTISPGSTISDFLPFKYHKKQAQFFKTLPKYKRAVFN